MMLVLMLMMLVVIFIVFMMMLVIIVMVMMLVLIIVVVMLVLMVIIVLIVILFMMSFNFLYPCCGGSDGVKVKHLGVDNPVKIHITIVAFNYFRLWLQGTNYLLNFRQFLTCHLVGLVQQYDIAEFYLLNKQVFYVILIKISSHEAVAVAELIPHSHSVDNRCYAVESCYALADEFRSHGRV